MPASEVEDLHLGTKTGPLEERGLLEMLRQ